MELNQVLVAYKQVSTTPHAGRGSRHARVLEGNALHLRTLDELYEILKELGISFSAQSVRQLRNTGIADLVITVGGDGTVLATSHFVNDIPVLGIKSFGRQSVGYFCAARRETMKAYLISLLKGKRKPIKLHRLQAAINGRKLAELALNDILFAHALPASTSRYFLSVGKKSEEQKSSGLWVSTAAGSTAALRAAGGKRLPLTSNKIEYIIREPYPMRRHFSLSGGVLPSHATIKIISYMPQGTVSVDGGVVQYPVMMNGTVTIQSAKKPLLIFWK